MPENIGFWGSVVANEQKNIYPNLEGVDFSVNSMMAYEICVIKPYVLPLLEEILPTSEHFEKAKTLIDKFKNIPIIDSKFIPDTSVFREFIGKKA